MSIESKKKINFQINGVIDEKKNLCLLTYNVPLCKNILCSNRGRCGRVQGRNLLCGAWVRHAVDIFIVCLQKCCIMRFNCCAIGIK